MDRLPSGYEVLEPYIDTWILPDSRARALKRVSSSYSDIKTFYDAMLPLAPQALSYLADYQLGALDPAQERLLKLLLSLARLSQLTKDFGDFCSIFTRNLLIEKGWARRKCV